MCEKEGEREESELGRSMLAGHEISKENREKGTNCKYVYTFVWVCVLLHKGSQIGRHLMRPDDTVLCEDGCVRADPCGVCRWLGHWSCVVRL